MMEDLTTYGTRLVIDPEAINERGEYTEAEILHYIRLCGSIRQARLNINDVTANPAGKYYGRGDVTLGFYSRLLDELKKDLSEFDKVTVELPAYALQAAV